jgi:hypothetical protein
MNCPNDKPFSLCLPITRKSIRNDIDAAETVLGFIGFDRTAYSNLKRNNDGRKKW